MDVPFPTAVERFPVLRQSVLSDANNCLLTSHWSLMHERGWSSHPAARGQIVHRALARCLDELEEYGPAVQGAETKVPVDVALEVLEDVARQATVPIESDDGMGDELVNLPISELAEARITVKTWAHYQAFSVDQFAGIEKRLESTLNYPGMEGRRISGKLDLLLIRGDHATVVDWKDTWGIPGERLRTRDGVIVGGHADHDPARPMEAGEAGTTKRPNVSEEGYFQQRFYALLLFHNYPRLQKVTLREFYLRYASGAVVDRQGRPINPNREATVERMDLGAIEMEMAALVERFDRTQQAHAERLATAGAKAEAEGVELDLEAAERHARRVFKPSPGSHCSYCVEPDACPIFPKARKVGRIRNEAEAELYAGRLVLVRYLSTQLGKALRAWSNIHGEVDVKDAKRPRVYGPVVRERVVKPSAEEAELARRKGVPIAELYKPEQYVEFTLHTPEEQHPFARQAAEEEAMLLAAEKAEADG